MIFIETIKKLDKLIFLLIHHDSDHIFLDNIMLAIRNPQTWIPLYLFLIFYSIKKMGINAWLFILFSIACVALTDSVSASLMKPFFGRERPCYDPQIHEYIRSMLDCGGVYSFPSSHAANHFGLATFWYWSIKKITAGKWNWLWWWAAIICYAQIYVGKHFPIDVTAGALLGWIIGLIMAKTFGYFWDKGFKIKQPVLQL